MIVYEVGFHVDCIGCSPGQVTPHLINLSLNLGTTRLNIVTCQILDAYILVNHLVYFGLISTLIGSAIQVSFADSDINASSVLL